MDSPPPPDALRQRAADALRAAWDAHYLDGHVRLTLLPNAPPSPPSAATADALTQPDHLRAHVAADPEQLRALAALARIDLPARAERARRAALLSGLGDVEPGLRRLIAAGLVTLIPEPGQRGWSLDDDLASRRFLQRDLLLPPPVLALILSLIDLSSHTAAPPIASIPAPSARIPTPTTDQLELNLLHLASTLNGDALLLNKDGSPNRRSLTRFLRSLHLDPASPPPSPSAPDAPLTALHTEHATFLLALGLQLDLLALDDPRTLVARPDGVAAYFTAPPEHRDAALLRALRTCARWDELDALAALHSDRSPRSADLRSSVTLDQPGLAAARSQTLDDLRKLGLDGWIRLDDLIDLLLALDRGYLTRALPPSASPSRFLRALLAHVLPWIGAAQLAALEPPADLAIHLTPRGRRILNLDPPAPLPAPNHGPPLFIQPNFEVTVFLAAASLADLHTLYRVGTRASLTEHTATFQLTAEAVQRGYGQGLNADDLVDFLDRRSRAPIPDAVAFTLRDWERVQRKITLYADGSLLYNPDPDRFDLVLGTLAHYWPDTHPPVVPLGATAAFLPTLNPKDLGRAVPDKQLHLIDYTQPPPPCLAPTAQDLTFSVLPTGLDLVTRAELPLLLDPADDPDPDLARLWRVNPDKLRARWPDHTARHTLDFLSPRLGDRLTADLELRILALLTDDTHAYVHTEATLLRVSSPEVCDKLLDLPAVVNSLLARLGPTTLLVEDAAADTLAALLERLGLDG